MNQGDIHPIVKEYNRLTIQGFKSNEVILLSLLLSLSLFLLFILLLFLI
jgi:hypothetical protein